MVSSPASDARLMNTFIHLTQTLQVVQNLQTDIQGVSQQISNLLQMLSAEIQTAACISSEDALTNNLNQLSAAWINYAGFTPSGEDVQDASTILNILDFNLQLVPQYGYQAPFQQVDVINTWAATVLDQQALFTDILNFGTILMGSDSLEGGVIANCALAVWEDWQLAEQISAVDDRQYWGPVSDWLLSLQVLQAQANHMIQQANLWM